MPYAKQTRPRSQMQPSNRRRGKRRQPTERFIWAWITVPLACMAVAYFLSSIEPPRITWEEIMIWMHVPSRNHDRYTRLAVLGLALIGVVAIARILRDRRDRP